MPSWTSVSSPRRRATSKEQVERILALGGPNAESLREDIEQQLLDYRSEWEKHIGDFFEYDEFDIRDFVQDNKALVDAIIDQSPTEYRLDGVPREEIATALRYEATRSDHHRHRHLSGAGILLWGDARYASGRFEYRFEIGGSYYYPSAYVPENGEFIPAEMATEFWDDIASDYGIDEWANGTSEIDDNTGYKWRAEDMVLVIKEEEFIDFCADLVIEQIDEMAKRDPDGTRDRFWAALTVVNQRLAESFKALNPSGEDVLNLAVAWFSSREHDEVLEQIEDHVEALAVVGAEEIPDRELVAEVTEKDLRRMGIVSGPFWEQRPWRLIKLLPRDLRDEGTTMRHCVGRMDMGYVTAVRNGEIEIWSLRSNANKPRFTLEVGNQFNAADRIAGQHGHPSSVRAEAIHQLKGKANRLAGYNDKKSANEHPENVQMPDEVAVWATIFDKLDVDASGVEDFLAYRRITRPQDPVPNVGEMCTGFDVPYRRREHTEW